MSMRVMMFFQVAAVLLCTGTVISHRRVSNTVTLNKLLPLLHCNTYCEGTVKMTVFPNSCQDGPKCDFCSCDNDCYKLGRCCPDHTGQIRTRRLEDHSCITVRKNKTGLEPFTSVYMKRSCVHDSGTYLPEKDESSGLHEVAPVTSLVTNTTYLNALVAECNNDTKHITWANNCLNLGHKISRCDHVLPANINPFPQQCHKNYIESCSTTWVSEGEKAHTKDRCENGPYYPVTEGENTFKNIFCYQCNGYSMPVFNCRNHRMHPMLGSKPYLPGIQSLWCTPCAKPKKSCARNQWLDPKNNVCFDIKCRLGLTLKGESCVVSEEDDILHQAVSVFTGNQSTLASTWRSLGRYIAEEIHLRLDSMRYMHSVVFIFEGRMNLLNTSSENNIFGLNFMFTANHSSNTHIDEDVSHIIDTILVSKTSGFIGVSANVVHRSKILYTDIYTKKTTADALNVSHVLLKHFAQTEQIVSIPRTFPSCAYVIVDNSFYSLSNDSLRFKGLDFDIHPDKFTAINQTTVVLCLKYLLELYESQDNLENAKNIVSLVFCTFSLFCLAVTLFTYCVFPSLLTLPTKNTMCLVTFLFLAQLTLQFGNLASKDELSCKIVGVLKHYFWLCVIFWMNVCSFHMFKVFVIDSSKPMNTENHNKRLVNYTLYANGISLAIPLLVIAINLVQTGGKDIGYGSARCYLTTPLLVGVAFLLPLGVVVFVNIILFIITIRTMSKIHTSGRTANQDKGQMTVYIKLSSLTGMFWTFAILSDLLHQQVLVFIAIILNSSQGIFIFLSYIANKKILDIWKHKMSKKRVSAEVSSGTKSTPL